MIIIVVAYCALALYIEVSIGDNIHDPSCAALEVLISKTLSFSTRIKYRVAQPLKTLWLVHSMASMATYGRSSLLKQSEKIRALVIPQ
jgi:hypothetical protein